MKRTTSITSGMGGWLSILAIAIALLVALLPETAAAERNARLAALPNDMAADSVDALRNDPVQSFVFARMAAEVCRGRVLTAAEEERFLTTLSYRERVRRDIDALAREVAALEDDLRDRIASLGCDHEAVRMALLDWDLRVTAFARIPSRNDWLRLTGTADRELAADSGGV